jgi:tight adherence protein B
VTGSAAVLAACAAAAAVWVRGWRPASAVDPAGRPSTRFRRVRVIAAALAGRIRPRAAPPIAELLAALAGELAAGQPPATALESAAADLDPDPCPRARQAARLGSRVPGALRQDAERPGGAGLRSLAACWEIADSSGAGLALAVERLAEGIRSAARARAQLDAEVAAARTSAKLLALLPLLGLLMGQWIGADPWDWLTTSWAGRGVLAAGLLLQATGLAWLRRIVASVAAEL